MAWKLMESTRTPKLWLPGSFRVRKISNNIPVPESFKGKPYSKYEHDKEKVIMIRLEKTGSLKASQTLSIGKNAEKFLDDDLAICYLDESAIYLCPYQAGQEFLEAFLKRERII